MRASFAAGVALLLLAAGCGRFWPTEPSYASVKTEDDLEFEAAADRRPTAKTLYGMARILARRNQDDQCRVVLTRILREHPDFMPAYCDLAELHLRQGRPEAAMATLEAARAKKPSDPVILNNLGLCRLERNQPAKALQMFTAAAAAAHASARYRANMAIALGLMGRYAESLALYRQVLTDDEAHRNLAVLCRARKDFARAQIELRQADAIVRRREMLARARAD